MMADGENDVGAGSVSSKRGRAVVDRPEAPSGGLAKKGNSGESVSDAPVGRWGIVYRGRARSLLR